MQTKIINDFEFIYKKESIIVTHNFQSICLHTFNVKNPRQRQKYIKDLRTMIDSADKMDINQVYVMARKSKVDAMGLTKKQHVII